MAIQYEETSAVTVPELEYKPPEYEQQTRPPVVRLTGDTTVTAKLGDSLSSIAEAVNAPFEDIKDLNPALSSVYSGMEVKVPSYDTMFGPPSSIEQPSVRLTGDTSQIDAGGNEVYQYSGFHDPSQEGGAINNILNQMEARGTYYNSAGELNNITDYRSIFTNELAAVGYRSVSDMLSELDRVAEETGKRPSEFAAAFDVPAIIPPQVAAMVFEGLWEGSDPNSLNEVASYYGYGFNPETQVFELGYEDTKTIDGGGSGGGDTGYTSQRSYTGNTKTSGGYSSGSVSMNMLNWRVATG